MNEKDLETTTMKRKACAKTLSMYIRTSKLLAFKPDI